MMNQHEIIYKNQENWQIICRQAQSPIHINVTTAHKMEDLGKIELYHAVDLLEAEKTELTILITAKARTIINGRIFHLIQFHFHSPAEHIIDHQRYEMELHFVHQAQNGRLAVFAIFIKVGEPNLAFEQILKSASDPDQLEPSLLIEALLPMKKSYYHYLGSLTTPPLTENVEWYVFDDPITISNNQLTHFRSLYHGTAREIQPLNGRPVLYNHNCCN